MTKQTHDRKQRSFDSKSHYEMMAEKKPDEKAKEKFRSLAYCGVYRKK